MFAKWVELGDEVIIGMKLLLQAKNTIVHVEFQ